MQSSTLAKRAWILFFLAIAVFYLYGLGAFPLLGPDEPRYAEVAREMLARHDLITPTLGGLPWFEKPPLLYWLMMASYRAFGVSEYSARLGGSVCALLTGLCVFLIAGAIAKAKDTTDASGESEELGHDFANWCALIFLSSAGAIVFSRGASFDIVVTMTIAAALACFLGWDIRRQDPAGTSRAKAALLFGFYFFVGVSLLAKGLVGVVIPFGVIALYSILRREWPHRALLVSLLWGFPLALAVASIWYGPMYLRHGWTFIDQFIIQHHFARFVSKKYHHPEPFYYYFLILPLLVLPWLAVFVTALAGARRWNWRGDTARDRMRVFSLAWILMPIAFFSFSESKLPAYILPILPAAALLTTDLLARLFRGKDSGKAMRVTGALVLGGSAIDAGYTSRHVGVTLLCVALLAFPLILAGAIALLRPRARQSVTAIAIATFLGTAMAIKCVAPVAAERQSVRGLLETAAARGYGAAPVVQLHTLERPAEFYAAGRLSYQPDGEPVRFDDPALITDVARRTGGPVLVLLPIDAEWKLHLAMFHLQAERLGDNGAVVISVVRIAP